ncbi:MAG TPA: phytase [Planctomycetota bacterium]|nr:phytase [Planctomycetota bacterium]
MLSTSRPLTMRVLAAWCLALSFAARGGLAAEADIVRPEARLETDPVPHGADAADDPAIWLHPTDPAKSLIIGTDKQGALHVYGMDGHERQRVSDGCRPDNVDVLYGFKLGDRVVDLAVASTRASKASGVKVWRIDPETCTLTDVTAGGTLPVFGGRVPYGVCTYHSAKTGKTYFIVVDKAGRIEQHELHDAGAGTVKAAKVRELKLSSITEGCVADDELGFVYVAEENVGIWKFAAEPDGGDHATRVAKVGEHGLTADVEGLTIYGAAGGKGYLIASSQGSNTFVVYTREGDNGYVLTIDPKEGRIDDVNDTDGIAVINRPTSPQFPGGFLVVQDGSNKGGNQDFKLYDWRDIAGTRLLIDTEWNPRGR